MTAKVQNSPSALLVTLAEVVGHLRAGLTPAQAWAGAGIGGVDVAGVPAGLGEGPTPAAVRAACRLAHEAGTPLAVVLEAVAQQARVECDAQAARAAAMAGPRMSATILGWLPAAGLGMGALVDSRALQILFMTPLGWVLLVTAASLAWAGRRWMRYLVESARTAGAEPTEPPGRGAGRGRGHADDASEVSTVLLLALVAAAIESGLDVRGALAAVARAVGGAREGVLEHVASSLALGVSWDAAWRRAPDWTRPLERALRIPWNSGGSPQATLEAAAYGIGLERRLASERAVGELSVRMALPLTLCLLPAFALVGLAPMLVAVAASAGLSEW